MTCFCVYGKIDHMTNYCKLGLRQVAASLNLIEGSNRMKFRLGRCFIDR